ncbi:unnamed protein product [Psylliodes chrysocephalus]|uniref:Uncharacterized protein n=1 Tax=Psylliodes chrysocephalus TaxID=3402493 RepID=A0A9P0GE09_9CUCU|nr:unnamed protein product [Psylliodes chrysocephala]
MRENSIGYWIEEAKEVAGKIGVEPIPSNKRIPRCKKQFDEMCNDESQILQPVQLFSQATKMLFDRVLSEIKKRVDGATTLNSNFAFLNGTKFWICQMKNCRSMEQIWDENTSEI